MASKDTPETDFDIIDIDDDDEVEENTDQHPAPITIRATSTSNPKRPRTLRAGYERRTQTMTVIFRPDGNKPAMWWNYYNVPPGLWDEFRSATSKGRFLKYGIWEGMTLDTWPTMGPANVGAMSPRMVEALGRSGQIQQGRAGKQLSRISGPMGRAAVRRYMKSLGQE